MDTNDENPGLKSVVIHNKISPIYRELHIDGAHGGLTPKGMLNLSFYAERHAIPKSTEYALNDNFTLGEVIANSDDSKKGIVREYEFGVYMDIKSAEELRNFLDLQIQQFRKAQQLHSDFGKQS